MGKFGTLTERIENTTTPWEGHTGSEVEDFICTLLDQLAGENIKNVEYDLEKGILTITKSNGEVLSADVTVAPITYNYGIWLYGIDINGTVYYESDKRSITTQYNEDKIIKVGIVLYATAHAIGNPSDRPGPFDVTIKYGTKKGTYKVSPVAKDKCIVDSSGSITGIQSGYEDQVAWIDVTSLFSKLTSASNITLTVDTITYSSNTKVTTDIITLAYNGNIVLNSNSLAYSLSGVSNLGDYKLEGYIYDSEENLTSITSEKGKFEISGLSVGLNKIAARVVNQNNTSIYSDWVYTDVIYTDNKSLNKTVVAVNNASNSIINNGIATIYKLTVYKPGDGVTINTYLQDEIPESDLSNLSGLLKSEVIDDSYLKTTEDTSYETSYSKYIEVDASDTTQYLAVTVDGLIYKFVRYSVNAARLYTYRRLTVDAIVDDYVYYKQVTPIYNYDQISGYTNNVFVTDTYASASTAATIISDLEASDGWTEENGRTIFRVSAQDKDILKSPIQLNLENEFTFEFGFKTFNVSDESQPIFTIGNFLLRPTLFCWNTSDEDTFNKRNAIFNSDEETHILVTVKSGYTIDKNDIYYPDYLGSLQKTFDDSVSSYTINLVRIYVNGNINREIILQNSEISALKQAKIQIHPTSSDIDFYLFRIYGSTALDFPDIQKNYISFLKNRSDKDSFYEKNDILNSNGEIDFEKSYQKYNTLVYVLSKDLNFPSKGWGSAMSGDTQSTTEPNQPVTLFINYSDESINKIYGGRITNGLIKGQGSSAMRYLIWNVAFNLNKYKIDGKKQDSIFTPNKFLDADTNKFKDVDTNQTIVNGYKMPPYDGQVDSDNLNEDLITKLVGKVNYASSMQSHKIGACKLYNDAALNAGLKYTGKKAVHEEPFLYFYLQTDLDDVSNVELADILDNNSNVKFMGFQTWGSAKGDKATFGYSKDTPEYMLFEGAENSDYHCNFMAPWQELQRKDSLTGNLGSVPNVTYAESLEDPSKNLLIKNDSIYHYGTAGAWDIDFGNNDDGDGIIDDVATTFKKFREFVDFVYLNDFNIEQTANSDTSVWKVNTKYVLTAKVNPTTNGEAIVNNHTAGDVYRYSRPEGKWVRAGLEYDSTNGWSTFNILTYTNTNDFSDAILTIKEKFKEGIKEYVDINDIAFHQAFIKFVSGTDNRAKNTYWQLTGIDNDYKVRLIQDDLDTIFATDNNGLQSKAYNLLEPSYRAEDADSWGDDGKNVFFRSFDQCFEENIINYLQGIIQFTLSNSSNVSDTGNYLYKNFFAVQSDYPAVAFNHVAKIYYETAQIIKNMNLFSGWDSNGVDPITQSHGSSLEYELYFMDRRLRFLSSYALTSTIPGTTLDTSAGSGGSGFGLQIKLDFLPYQDFYPSYKYDTTVSHLYTNSKADDYVAVKNLVTTDNTYTATINQPSGDKAINQCLYQVDLYKTLKIDGLLITSFSPTLSHLTNFTIDNSNSDYTTTSFASFTASLPVLENLVLNNMSLPTEMDLEECNKLLVLDLTNTTNIESVIFPQSGRLKTVILPSCIKNFTIYNNLGLSNVQFESILNLESIYINCSKVGTFDVLDFCERLVSSSTSEGCPNLESITLTNANLYLTEEAVNKIIYTNNCTLKGDIYIIDKVGDTNLKTISFATKLILVNKFGNIDSEDSSIRFHYQDEEILTKLFTCNKSVSVYRQSGETLPLVRQNMFDINVASGNNVRIVSGTNPFNSNVDGYLDISYKFTTTITNATIDSLTGAITLKSESSSPATVEITLVTKNGTKYTCQSTVSFLWQAPQLGDFAYADGSFASSYDSSKTMVGIVYATDSSNSDNTAGTAYILGKEYSRTLATNETMYLGYADDGDSSVAQTEVAYTIYQVGLYLTNILNIDDSDFAEIHSRSSYQSTLDSITKDSYDNIPTPTYGDTDTLLYVDRVNNLLETLYSKYSWAKNFIKISGETYYIDTINDLVSLESNLKTLNVYSNIPSGKESYLTCILFPYFYAMHLYQPSVLSNETLDEQYAKGNWYAPSINELSRILYYRGYSVSGENFNASSIVRNSISTNVTNGGTPATTPIFSLAMSRISNAGGKFPEVWTNISNSDGNNMTTTTVSSQYTHNYGYGSIPVSYNSDSNTMTYEDKWVPGANSDYYQGWWGASVIRQMWRCSTPHSGIPFVKYTYSKP